MAHAPTGTKEATAGGVLIALYFVIGGSFVGFGFLPEGLTRQIVVIALAVAMVGVFFWLLISRLIRLFAGHGSYVFEACLAGLNVALLICAFAGIYSQLGLADTTGDGSESVTYRFTDTLYFSVVTFTTLGYGDLQPRGACRVLVGIETFVGYVVLGLIASTATSFIQATAKQRRDGGEVAPVDA